MEEVDSSKLGVGGALVEVGLVNPSRESGGSKRGVSGASGTGVAGTDGGSPTPSLAAKERRAVSAASDASVGPGGWIWSWLRTSSASAATDKWASLCERTVGTGSVVGVIEPSDILAQLIDYAS